MTRAVRLGVIGLALGLALAVTTSLRADENWATQRARELTAQGDTHRDSGHVELAVERYRQAIEIDPTFAGAYLALGKLREASGDLDEADRTYSLGIDHVSGFADALLARGELRLHAAKIEPAFADMLAALALRGEDAKVVRRVRDACIPLGRLPVALALSRRLAALAHQQGDDAVEHEATVTASALEVLVGFVDPVASGAQRGPVRVALAKIANKGAPSRAASGSAPGASAAKKPAAPAH